MGRAGLKGRKRFFKGKKPHHVQGLDSGHVRGSNLTVDTTEKLWCHENVLSSLDGSISYLIVVLVQYLWGMGKLRGSAWVWGRRSFRVCSTRAGLVPQPSSPLDLPWSEQVFYFTYIFMMFFLPFRRLSATEPVGHGEKPLTVSQLKPSSFQIDSLSHYNSHLSLQQNVTDTVTKQYGSIKTDSLLRQAVYLERCTPAVQ